MAGYHYYPSSYDASYGTFGQQQGASAQYGNASPSSPTRTTHARLPPVVASPRRASTQKELKRVEERDLVLGRVFWLPPKEELPARAVRRAHGKGAVEEGIYNHPVVVISRPTDEPGYIHFHIITSFQGKRLHEIYSKGNEFHASRRSWYLPISPSPAHPDATSKKMQKRFPTLDLKDGAVLRWDSYVNIRHVYKIEWNLLKPYANPDTPHITSYRFDRESCDKMLAKTKVLTNYEPGPQQQQITATSYGYSNVPFSQERPPVRRATEPPPQLHQSATGRPPRPRVQPPVASHEYRERVDILYSPKSISDGSSIAGSSAAGSEYAGLSPILQSDFGEPRTEDARDSPVPRDRPPDDNNDNASVLGRFWRITMWVLAWPLIMLRRIRR